MRGRQRPPRPWPYPRRGSAVIPHHATKATYRGAALGTGVQKDGHGVAGEVLGRFLVLPEPCSQGMGPEQAGDPGAQGVCGIRGRGCFPTGEEEEEEEDKEKDNGAGAGLLPRS